MCNDEKKAIHKVSRPWVIPAILGIIVLLAAAYFLGRHTAFAEIDQARLEKEKQNLSTN